MNAEARKPDGEAPSPAEKRRRSALSCRRLLEYAGVLAAGFVLFSLAGYRRDPGVLLGMQRTGVNATLGIVYMLLYATVVLIVPVLVIASGLLKATALLLRRRREPSTPCTSPRPTASPSAGPRRLTGGTG